MLTALCVRVIGYGAQVSDCTVRECRLLLIDNISNKQRTGSPKCEPNNQFLCDSITKRTTSNDKTVCNCVSVIIFFLFLKYKTKRKKSNE